jgi:N-acetylglucosamine kinase-like BadF-type ATPase
VTAGGWGPALADQGSGHFIGLEALRRGFLARDQQRPTQLLNAAMSFWQLPSFEALIEHANAIPAPDYSKLAPMVVELAANGDAVAAEVLAKGGDDLAYLAGLVIERLRHSEDADGLKFEVPEIAFAGSILQQVQAVRVALQVALLGVYPQVVFQPMPVDPVLGALWRARNAAALHVTVDA